MATRTARGFEGDDSRDRRQYATESRGGFYGPLTVGPYATAMAIGNWPGTRQAGIHIDTGRTIPVRQDLQIHDAPMPEEEARKLEARRLGTPAPELVHYNSPATKAGPEVMLG